MDTAGDEVVGKHDGAKPRGQGQPAVVGVGGGERGDRAGRRDARDAVRKQCVEGAVGPADDMADPSDALEQDFLVHHLSVLQLQPSQLLAGE